VLPVIADGQDQQDRPGPRRLQVHLSSDQTGLDPGRYTDAQQVTEGNSSDLFWIRQICVTANPFNV
jgi:hypothetical protein